jgi:hydroxymethylbilane synthase
MEGSVQDLNSGSNILTIGTRGSRLALAQAHWIRDLILARSLQVRIDVRTIDTSADLDQMKSLRTGSETGLFAKEIEESLLAREIDLAVHSLKDLPIKQPEALEIKVIPLREDPRDALVIRGELSSLEEIPPGSSVGTGSIRRQAQILAVRPDLKVKDIRGNVDTRLRKLALGEYDAVILACAGLIRLGMQDRINKKFGFDQMLPAPGQGALALETRRDDHRVGRLIEGLHHPQTAISVIAERTFLSQLGGGCNTPMGVIALTEGNLLEMEGMIATPNGSDVIRDSITGPADSAIETARSLAERIISRGGKSILNTWR